MPGFEYRVIDPTTGEDMPIGKQGELLVRSYTITKAYYNKPEETAKALCNREVDAIAFTSGKTVVHTAKLMLLKFGKDWTQLFDCVNLISIGPQTSLSCKKYLNRVDQEADPHDLDGLINACINSFKEKDNHLI